MGVKYLKTDFRMAQESALLRKIKFNRKLSPGELALSELKYFNLVAFSQLTLAIYLLSGKTLISAGKSFNFLVR